MKQEQFSVETAPEALVVNTCVAASLVVNTCVAASLTVNTCVAAYLPER
ncbi:MULTISPECIES: hypothetical protein [Amycolatopsis]|uniref:Uncharacterized protein n=1 Tax=Amycolatopsis lexingtonensis TaxID=218822 RepID=A0ABR9IG48_9PSEU|nr:MULTISPECIES: hypothetical protein [Amycolatopsis]MBE1502163.1 hypothetical protein [Amycolatopsis lexingtonensis]UOX89545.1 hypothetical protein MUY14_02560 [Amycolatopsis sp. FBCC-B4732]